MLKLGAHVSISGSIYQAVDRAVELKCNTFQIFTRNPQGWRFKELDPKEVEEFIRKVKENKLVGPVAHAPYLPNLASPRDDIYKLSVETLRAELDRCGKLHVPYLVMHLGSHLGAGIEAGLKRLVEGCNKALSSVRNNVMFVLEIMAGQKNSMGSTFEDVKRIYDGIEQKDRVGICFDTCHAFAAGYDLRDRKTLNETIRKFDEIIGLKLLMVVHLNDSKGELGLGLDRHEHIGMGQIGKDGFRAVLHHPALKKLPMILETPDDERGDYSTDLNTLRKLAKS